MDDVLRAFESRSASDRAAFTSDLVRSSKHNPSRKQRIDLTVSSAGDLVIAKACVPTVEGSR